MKKKTIKVRTITSMEQFHHEKPRFNAYATGHGFHESRKYSRNKKKREDKRLMSQRY